MKNALTTKLLCGVIATSFLLINCQKAPEKRAVKATPRSGSGTTTTTTTKTSDVVVKCNEEMNKLNAEIKSKKEEIKKLSEAAIKAKADDKELDQSDKDELTTKSNEYDKLITKAVEALTELKADRCTLGSTKDSTESKENLKKDALLLGSRVSQITGVENEASKKATKEGVTLDKNALAKDKELFVTKDLAEVLVSENKDGKVYFLAAEIVKDKEDYEDVTKNLNKTVCSIVAAPIEKLEAGTKLTVSIEPELTEVTLNEVKRKQLMVVFKSDRNDDLVSFKCVIAKGKDSEARRQFRAALGGANLKTTKEAAIDNEAKEAAKIKKEETAAKKAEAKKVVDTKKSILDRKTTALAEVSAKNRIDLQALEAAKAALAAEKAKSVTDLKGIDKAEEVLAEAQKKADESSADKVKAEQAKAAAKAEHEEAKKKLADIK